MSSVGDWNVPSSLQPRAEDYTFDLEDALSSVVGIRTHTHADAFTADTLGDERHGSGVLIPGGLVLTVGYLVVEAEAIWLTFSDGSSAQGHTLGYDQQTGFAIVQPLARIELPAFEFGTSSGAAVEDRIVLGAPGGLEHSIAGHIVARQEFAGYWEYVLDDAIFTAPAHPHWGGAPLIDMNGKLIGIGSLQLQSTSGQGEELPINMSIPIDLLHPIIEDLKKMGRANRPVRPWLGLYSADIDGEVVVLGLARNGPAEQANMDAGDIIVSVAGEEILDLADFYRKVWQLGEAGVDVPIAVARADGIANITIKSGDRSALLKKPLFH